GAAAGVARRGGPRLADWRSARRAGRGGGQPPRGDPAPRGPRLRVGGRVQPAAGGAARARCLSAGVAGRSAELAALARARGAVELGRRSGARAVLPGSLAQSSITNPVYRSVTRICPSGKFTTCRRS